VFRGSEDDVLARVIGAAASASADTIVEITGDCPVIDPDIIEQVIRMFDCHDADYASNVQVRSFPDGMDTQVFALETLERSAGMVSTTLEREHVTMHIRTNPHLFPPVHLVAPPSLHWPELGLTLDEQGDFLLLKNLIESFGGQHFSCLDAIRRVRENLHWLEYNDSVKRKGLT
jgi:spore coat polysaccharide biosynthesis protein SpsF